MERCCSGCGVWLPLTMKHYEERIYSSILRIDKRTGLTQLYRDGWLGRCHSCAKDMKRATGQQYMMNPIIRTREFARRALTRRIRRMTPMGALAVCWNSRTWVARRDGIPCPDRCPIRTATANCPALGTPLTYGATGVLGTSPSFDRLDPDPTVGYVEGNVHVISLHANAIKNNATPDEILRVASWTYQGWHKRDGRPDPLSDLITAALGSSDPALRGKATTLAEVAYPEARRPATDKMGHGPDVH